MVKQLNSYESMYAELQANILLLQSGELSIDDALKKYEHSTKLIKKLRTYLESAQNTVINIKTNLDK